MKLLYKDNYFKVLFKKYYILKSPDGGIGRHAGLRSQYFGVSVRVSLEAPNNAGVAQLVERYLAKVNVVSSNLIARSTFRSLVKWISYLSSKQVVGVRSSQDRPIRGDHNGN